MVISLLENAIELHLLLNIHLVSGEFYTGKPNWTPDPNVIVIETEDANMIDISVWSIKRVKVINKI
ncbi:hypothetical protein BK126_18815 [Paenibacillus sp. FSL H7-0326]|uniref:hypothetical protein n=1 Tax=Paenibacillus sp. FSL H7-0326 TaxID=1921144 RepID=UPI00096DF783|nr:hypothetical protein BK126_18815 [Paenibacillus sp. FSL H7-0326]